MPAHVKAEQILGKMRQRNHLGNAARINIRKAINLLTLLIAPRQHYIIGNEFKERT